MLEKVTIPQFDNQISTHISAELLDIFQKRKTTRDFSDQPVSLQIILNAIAIAGTAPSGANKQPWTFAVIGDEATKKIIRDKAEDEERKFYEETAPQKWLDDLKPLHTNSTKEFITNASYLVPVFAEQYGLHDNETKSNNYYVKESVGIATGMLISALHLAGLSVLTYTPTNRNFLVDLLGRPRNERTFMVVVVGRPAEGAESPLLSKKTLNQIVQIYQSVENNRYQV